MRAWARLERVQPPTEQQKKLGIKPATERQRLEKIEAQTGRRDPLLDQDKPPEGFEYLWRLFFEIRGGASEGFSGPCITWRDLADYSAVQGIALDPFEAGAIMAMDGALRSELAEATP